MGTVQGSEVMTITIKTNARDVARYLDLSARELRNYTAAAMREEVGRIKKDYEKTTSTWNHKPHFDVIIDDRGPVMEALVGTDDHVFGFVDRGTKAHRIEPKGPWPLRFRFRN